MKKENKKIFETLKTITMGEQSEIDWLIFLTKEHGGQFIKVPEKR